MSMLSDSGANRRKEFIWALGLFTRLPLPVATPPSESAFAGCVWAFPVVGAVIGLAGALTYAIAHLAGLPATLAALLALVATVALTGALHEDGLADFWDGIGGGATLERKLAIMRDPRIGSFGAIAILLSIAARWSALASLADVLTVTVGLVAAHAASRASLIPLFFLLKPIREDGLGATAGRPGVWPALVGLGLAVLLLFFALPPLAALLGLIVALASVMLVGWIAKRQLGGHTGDVFGAAEQTAEIGFLCALVPLL